MTLKEHEEADDDQFLPSLLYDRIVFVQLVKDTKTTSNQPRGGENPLTVGVKQAVPYRTGREAW